MFVYHVIYTDNQCFFICVNLLIYRQNLTVTHKCIMLYISIIAFIYFDLFAICTTIAKHLFQKSIIEHKKTVLQLSKTAFFQVIFTDFLSSTCLLFRHYKQLSFKSSTSVPQSKIVALKRLNSFHLACLSAK